MRCVPRKIRGRQFVEEPIMSETAARYRSVRVVAGVAITRLQHAYHRRAAVGCEVHVAASLRDAEFDLGELVHVVLHRPMSSFQKFTAAMKSSING